MVITLSLLLLLTKAEFPLAPNPHASFLSIIKLTSWAIAYQGGGGGGGCEQLPPPLRSTAFFCALWKVTETHTCSKIMRVDFSKINSNIGQIKKKKTQV